jgi:hypothetical protein
VQFNCVLRGVFQQFKITDMAKRYIIKQNSNGKYYHLSVAKGSFVVRDYENNNVHEKENGDDTKLFSVIVFVLIAKFTKTIKALQTSHKEQIERIKAQNKSLK